jgi:hypothetical protein
LIINLRCPLFFSKSTSPVGVPPTKALTTAVKVTDCPKVEGLGAEPRVVVVELSIRFR